MMLVRAHGMTRIGFKLAAATLLRCEQAAGAHHQTTPTTRAPVASTPRSFNRSVGKRQLTPTGPESNVASIGYVAVFIVGLTGLLASGISLAIHPLTAVLLALGGMAVLLHALAELLQVSQVQLDHPKWDQNGKNPKLY